MRTNNLSSKLQRESNKISKNYSKSIKGDISVETNKNGALLKINSGVSDYFAKLDSSRDVLSAVNRESGYYMIEHMTWPTTHAKDAWLTFNAGLDNTRTFISALSFTATQLKFIPEDTYVHEVKWMVDNNTSGDWGLRIWKYKKNKGGMTTKANHEIIWTNTINFAPEKGVQYSYPVKLSLKAGDLIAIEGYAPSTTGFSVGKYAFFMQNRVNNK
tara:strand:+ start:22284 stop:22928 length:645 start_codon:yes stop_codon:yes gene_type:complete